MPQIELARRNNKEIGLKSSYSSHMTGASGLKIPRGATGRNSDGGSDSSSRSGRSFNQQQALKPDQKTMGMSGISQYFKLPGGLKKEATIHPSATATPGRAGDGGDSSGRQSPLLTAKIRNEQTPKRKQEEVASIRGATDRSHVTLNMFGSQNNRVSEGA